MFIFQIKYSASIEELLHIVPMAINMELGKYVVGTSQLECWTHECVNHSHPTLRSIEPSTIVTLASHTTPHIFKIKRGSHGVRSTPQRGAHTLTSREYHIIMNGCYCLNDPRWKIMQLQSPSYIETKALSYDIEKGKNSHGMNI